MRTWQQYLYQNKAALDDFLAWGETIKENLVKSISLAASTNDINKVTALSIELTVYNKILQSMKAEIREDLSNQKLEEKKKNVT